MVFAKGDKGGGARKVIITSLTGEAKRIIELNKLCEQLVRDVDLGESVMNFAQSLRPQFEVEVNCEGSSTSEVFDRLVRAGRYDRVSRSITVENFPIHSSSIYVGNLPLLLFTKHMTLEDVSFVCMRLGYRSATMEQFLALGQYLAEYPSEDNFEELVVLGPNFANKETGVQFVPVRYHKEREKVLDTWYLGEKWKPGTAFVVARNE